MNKHLALSIIGLAFLSAAVPEVHAQHDHHHPGLQESAPESELRGTQSSNQQPGVEEPVPEPELRGTQV